MTFAPPETYACAEVPTRATNINIFSTWGYLDLGLSNDEPIGRGDKAHEFLSVAGMELGLFGHHRA